mgnify:CR=1 FL=1
MILKQILITFTDDSTETIYTKYRKPETDGIMEELEPDIDIHYEIDADDSFRLFDEFQNEIFVTKWSLIKHVKIMSPYKN